MSVRLAASSGGQTPLASAGSGGDDGGMAGLARTIGVLEERTGNLNRRLDGIDARLDKVEGRLGALEALITSAKIWIKAWIAGATAVLAVAGLLLYFVIDHKLDGIGPQIRAALQAAPTPPPRQ